MPSDLSGSQAIVCVRRVQNLGDQFAYRFNVELPFTHALSGFMWTALRIGVLLIMRS